MITKDDVLKGFRAGIIQLVVDQNFERGTVCQIGELWFYFGLPPAEYLSPDELRRDVSLGCIVDAIYRTLMVFREDELFRVEYLYYAAVLAENLKHN